MSDDDIKRLRELAQAATKGPWKHLQSGRGYENYVYALDARYDVSWAGESPVKVAYFPHDPYGLRDALDAAYIAAASPDAILALLSRLESAERERDCAAEAQRAAENELARQVARNAMALSDTQRERDAMAALLREAQSHLRIGGALIWDTPGLIERIDAALAAKEQK